MGDLGLPIFMVCSLPCPPDRAHLLEYDELNYPALLGALKVWEEELVQYLDQEESPYSDVYRVDDNKK